MTAQTIEERTYGNFKPARRRLLGGLGPIGLLACLVVVLIAFMALVAGSLFAALVVLMVGAVVIVPIAWEVGGHSVADRIVRWTLFSRAARQQHTVYRSGVISPMRGTCRLPGIAWNSMAFDVETGRAGWPAVGIVVMKGPPRIFAVTLRCNPSGTTLVDRSTVDSWIASHAAWLEALGREPDLVQAQVTVETAPDLGFNLARSVYGKRSDTAPALADQVMTEIVDTYPRAAARTDTRVTLVFSAPRPTKSRSGGPMRRVTDQEMCKRIAGRLPAMAQALRAVGAGVVTPMSAADLAATCRLAYDPAAAPDVDVAGSKAIVWANCGPVAATENRDHYLHDSGVSVTWATAEAPRALLHDTALSHLSTADPALLRKRVSIMFRPLSPAQTAKAVDADVRDAQFRAGRQVRPSARSVRDVEAAAVTAKEEAAGAGLVNWSILYTATVASVDELDRAEASIRDLGAVTRLNLRRMDYSQAAAFAAGLPIGVVPSLMAHIKG